MHESGQLARVFRVFAAEARVRILHHLKQRPLCVNALAGRLGISQAAASQHLRILRDAGVLIAEKRGYFVHYRVNEAVLGRWKRLADSLLDAKQR